jgi:hypothetical protein
MTSADSTMAGQFITVRALDRARHPIENQVRSRVEQDEVTSEETIRDIVRKPRQHSQDVGRHCGERFVFG